MSPDEQREQRVRLQIDFEDAEKDLAYLREAANSNADMLEKFAHWLRVSPETHIFLNGSSLHHGFEVQVLP